MSGGEILLIVAVALLLFGSKSIPEMARLYKKGMTEFNKATSEIKKEFETHTSDIQKDITDISRDFKTDVNKIKDDIDKSSNINV